MFFFESKPLLIKENVLSLLTVNDKLQLLWRIKEH